MARVEIFRRIIGKLGGIPGLSFLHGWVSSADVQQARFLQKKGDYEGWVHNAREAGRGVGELAGHKGGGDEGGSASSPIDEDGSEDSIYPSRPAEFVEDYYDLYEGDSLSGNESDAGNLRVDDYPQSDDDVAYYDDDYRGSR
ncbi:MAG: hypothetical protein AAGJ46_03365 [Planctomycetota bacterium]